MAEEVTIKELFKRAGVDSDSERYQELASYIAAHGVYAVDLTDNGSESNTSQTQSHLVLDCIEQELPKHGEKNRNMLGYNENGHLSEFEENNYIVRCSHCNRKYIQEQIEQAPGFREVDDDICPYCHAVNGRSGEVEYFNCKINESEEEK